MLGRDEIYAGLDEERDDRRHAMRYFSVNQPLEGTKRGTSPGGGDGIANVWRSVRVSTIWRSL